MVVGMPDNLLGQLLQRGGVRIVGQAVVSASLAERYAAQYRFVGHRCLVGIIRTNGDLAGVAIGKLRLIAVRWAVFHNVSL